MTLLIVFLALVLDKLLGEPSRWHPLVGFGRYALWLERHLNPSDPAKGRGRGLMALLLATLPFVAASQGLAIAIQGVPWLKVVVSALVLYMAVGWQSLLQHARMVADPLQRNDLVQSRQAVAMLVSRDVAQLDSEGVAKAATESVLENGADALFSALFWFLVAGIPGVVLYRLANTLDAMWGYRTERFERFGCAAARFDDLLNYLPARLTALGYALAGKTGLALRCWRSQGRIWKSPNAGPVMAAGAGALGVTLGGEARYFQHTENRPLLGPDTGEGSFASADTILAACRLVNRTLWLWVAVLSVGSLLS